MKKAFTVIELLVVISIIAILSAIVVGGTSCSSSVGTRAGTLVKFSYKGLFGSTKSWEGELMLGGVRSGAANTWDFSVPGNEATPMALKLEKLVDKHVIMKYRQTIVYNPLKRETSYIVTDVAEIDPKAEK